MKDLDKNIRDVLADDKESYDLDREEGVFRQLAGLYRGRMRWMAIAVVIETILAMVLLVLAVVGFFRADETKWQIGYATSVVLLALLLLLIKVWGWMQMTANAIHRDIKRLELRLEKKQS